MRDNHENVAQERSNIVHAVHFEVRVVGGAQKGFDLEHDVRCIGEHGQDLRVLQPPLPEVKLLLLQLVVELRSQVRLIIVLAILCLVGLVLRSFVGQTKDSFQLPLFTQAQLLQALVIWIYLFDRLVRLKRGVEACFLQGK